MGKKIDYSATEQAQLTSEGRESDLARLKANNARALPSSPSASGWSADAIKRQLYRPSELLFAWLVKLAQAQLALAQKADDALDGETARLDQDVADLNALISSKEQSLLAEITSQVTQEAATRGSADTALGERITREVSARQSEDTAIRELIAAITASGEAKYDSDHNVIVDTYATKEKVAEIEDDVTALEEGTVKKSEIVNNVTSEGETGKPLAAGQGYVLQSQIDAINDILQSTDTDLDTIQEIVTYIKNNKSLIENVTTSKVSVSDILDNLTSEVANKPLSAKQGKVLKGLIDALTDRVSGDEGTIALNTAARHTHSNKDVLDATTASYTESEKQKLSSIEAGAEVNVVLSVAGKTGAVTLGKGDVDLGNVDNTSDANKPVSTAQQTALDLKADKSTTYTKTEVDTALGAKEDAISDLSTIRSGAAAGATAVQPSGLKTINSTSLLGSGDISLATKAEHLKSLYHLGAYDSVDTSNADYDLITRNVGVYTFTGNETWTANGSCYRSQVLEGANKGGWETDGGTSLAGVPSSSHKNLYNGTDANGICIDEDGRICIGSNTYANRVTLLNGQSLYFVLATPYTEKVLKNQPLSTLDQNGENWLRGEYEKTLNLFDGQLEIGLYDVNAGTKGSNASYLRNKNLTSVNPSTTYTFSYSYNNARNIALYWICFYASNGSFISSQIFSEYDYGVAKTFTTPSNAYFATFNFRSNNGEIPSADYVYNIMLNSGSTAKPYQPYNGPVMHAIDVEGVKLWENGNPNVAFEPTTLTGLPLSEYRFLDIEYKFVPVGYRKYVRVNIQNTGSEYYGILMSNSTDGSTFARAILFSSGNIQIQAVYKNGATTTEALLIPTVIYGIK